MVTVKPKPSNADIQEEHQRSCVSDAQSPLQLFLEREVRVEWSAPRIGRDSPSPWCIGPTPEASVEKDQGQVLTFFHCLFGLSLLRGVGMSSCCALQSTECSGTAIRRVSCSTEDQGKLLDHVWSCKVHTPSSQLLMLQQEVGYNTFENTHFCVLS